MKSKRKALGQDPFKKDIFPWIKSTEKEDIEGIAVQTKTMELHPSKLSLQSKQGLQSNPLGTLRQTYHLTTDNIEKVKRYAYIERLKISEVVNRALNEFFEKKGFTK